MAAGMTLLGVAPWAHAEPSSSWVCDQLDAKASQASVDTVDGIVDAILLDTMLVVQLQRIHDYFKKPVKINSAYRTPAYNASVGGAGESFHTKGQAADIVVSGVSTQRVYDYCANTLNLPGVGRYAAKGFVHIDVGARAIKWRQTA